MIFAFSRSGTISRSSATGNAIWFLRGNAESVRRRQNMKPNWRDLIIWGGPIDRLPFLFWGCLLFAVKVQLDRFVPYFVGTAKNTYGIFGSLVSYVSFGVLPNFGEADNSRYFLTLLWIALPFIYFGVVLTFKRLNSAGLPVSLVVLFFIPYVNLLLLLPAVLSGTKGRP